MGVGINYKGVGGNRHFDLNGVPTGEADALFKTPRKHKQLLPENFKKALHPMPTDPIAKENEGKVKLNAFDMRPDTLDKKTMPGSAVTTSMSGLCLDGEQENPSVVGTKLYGSHGGKKGYHGFDEFDPPVSGGRVGPLGAGGIGADNSFFDGGAPVAYQVVSRIVMEIDNIGRTLLVEYDKDIHNTSLGRTHKVTGEVRRVIGILRSSPSGGAFLHPFKVVAVPVDDGYDYAIYLPAQSLTQNGKEISLIGGLTAKGGDWYGIPKESSTPNGVYLNVEIEDGALKASVSAAPVAPPESATSVMFILIAALSEAAVSQRITSAIALLPPSVDNNSIDLNDENKLQIAHFSDSEKDLSDGFVSRLKVDLETGKVSSANTDDLMLLARRNGEVVYVPIGSSGGDSPGEDDSEEGHDPCIHPGGGESVPSESDGSGVDGDLNNGGVPAGGEGETGGVDCCS